MNIRSFLPNDIFSAAIFVLAAILGYSVMGVAITACSPTSDNSNNGSIIQSATTDNELFNVGNNEHRQLAGNAAIDVVRVTTNSDINQWSVQFEEHPTFIVVFITWDDHSLYTTNPDGSSSEKLVPKGTQIVILTNDQLKQILR